MRSIDQDHASLIDRIRETEDKTNAAIKVISDEINLARPWLQGLRWAVGITGGMILVALMGGILWALVQSGAGLP